MSDRNNTNLNRENSGRRGNRNTKNSSRSIRQRGTSVAVKNTKTDLLLANSSRKQGGFFQRMLPVFLSFAMVLAGVYGFVSLVLGNDANAADGTLKISASDEASASYAMGIEAVKKNEEALMQVGAAVPSSGIAIQVNGKTMAMVSTKEEAQWVLNAIKSPYKAKENGEFKSGFKEKVTTASANGDPLGKEEALIKLTSGGKNNAPIINVVSTEVLESEKTVAYSTVKKNSSSLYKGETKVETKGQNGTSKTTTTITYVNGKETNRTKKTTVVKAPVNKVILVGTKARPTYSSSSSNKGGGGVAGAPSFRWPCAGRISSGYGRRWGTTHKGIDIANGKGTPIYAAASGTVTESDDSGWGGGYGYHITIRHNGTYSTRYAHMSKLVVRYGQKVSKGQLIGYMGSTGDSTGNHLHFEVIKNGGQVNPMPYLP